MQTRRRPSCATFSRAHFSRAVSISRSRRRPFKNNQKDASVALAIELDGDKLTHSAPDAKGYVANKVELSFYGLNELGKALAGTHMVLDPTLRPETRSGCRSSACV